MFPFFVVVSIVLGLITGGPAETDGLTAGLKPPAKVDTAGRCPLIYAPVICSNGRTYPNQCVADQHHAKNCVPTGDL